MTALVLLGAAGVLYLLAGKFYAGYIARRLGEDAGRVTPAVQQNDGRDYVPTPTHVVFGHHFASIAGAGPIVGPMLAAIYGWGPVWLWVVFGAIFFGAVHDYTALYVSMRSGGQSLAVVARRSLGKTAFALTIAFIIIMLLLVCATFLNYSATALTSQLPAEKLGQTSLFRTAEVNGQPMAQVGGIASMSVIVITAFAPLVGYLYLRRRVPVWICSILAVGICLLSVWVGIARPVVLDGLSARLAMMLPAAWVSPGNLWKMLLSVYVLAAAGIPVWILLQSRDFINVHILYIGLAMLVVGVLGAGLLGGTMNLPASDLTPERSPGPIWPLLFVTVACGAISGFHSLCAGGTSSKQIISEPAARRVGYHAMLLESLLAVAVLCVVGMGLSRADYLNYLYPATGKGNAVLAFGLAVGNAIHMGVPLISMAMGTVFAMLIFEGFLVTTLDTAVRLNRYLFEELWRTLLRTPPRWLVNPWLNSVLATGLMLWLAFNNTANSLWTIFGTANQLLAALVLIIVTCWLLQRGRTLWFTLVPAVLMFLTTVTMLVMDLVWVRVMPIWTVGLGAAKWELILGDLLMLVLAVGIVITALSKGRKPAGTAQAEEAVEAASTE